MASGRHAGGIEILARDDGRLLHEAIGHRLAERVVEDDVLERHRALGRFHERRGREFQADDRLQLVDRPHAGTGPVAVRLVHDQHEVGQPGQILEVTLADVFREPLDARRFSAAHFGVDLRDVEDVHLAAEQLVEQRARHRLVVVARDDLRGIRGELRDALEDILGRVRREVGDELVVDRQVRAP